jgi:SAM-dependent methyltransferase
MSDRLYKELLRKLSRRSRRKKFDLFQSVFQPGPSDRILDVGASGQPFTGYTFEDYYPYLERIVAGGIDLREVHHARRLYPRVHYAMFDGCALPFGDKSFDVVFSNAVVEHITGEGKQAQFAEEIMRVGKSWFVTTPNYWFPLESHYHLPFIQFLPRETQRWYNRLLGTAIPKGTVEDLALLSARQLQRLFPASRIVKMRLTFWPETLVAYSVDPLRAKARGGS